MVTLLDDQYQFIRLIPPGRAQHRVAKGLAEWVTAAKVPPDVYFGTLRMLPKPGDARPTIQRRDTMILVGPDGVPLIRLTPRGLKELRKLLHSHSLAAQTRGHCIILRQPLSKDHRQDILDALVVGVADGVAHRASLRREVMEVLARAGVADPQQASHQDLNRIARLLFADLKIRKTATLAEIIVLLGRTGDVLARPEIDSQPDMFQLRALMDATRKADQERSQQYSSELIENEAAGGLIEDIGSRRAGRGGGHQSIAIAQAHAAAAGQ